MDLKEKTNINILNTVPNALLGPSACPGKNAPKNRTAVEFQFHYSVFLIPLQCDGKWIIFPTSFLATLSLPDQE